MGVSPEIPVPGVGNQATNRPLDFYGMQMFSQQETTLNSKNPNQTLEQTYENPINRIIPVEEKEIEEEMKQAVEMPASSPR